jgi:predicted double-glycine peptidase
VKSGTELPGEHSIISTVAAELDFSSGYGTSLDEEIAVSSAISSPLISVPDFDTWYTNQYGSPVADSTVWHEQTTEFSCGIVSTEMVMKLFGLELSEAELVYEATSQGLLTENGMSVAGIQTLLESQGIETHIGRGDIADLAEELNAGHKIVIPLDSGEIWEEDSHFEDLLYERADHAVVLTGIDLDSIPPKVFLNDPGHPEGKAMEVELGIFVDAWNDSGNQFLATNDAPELA